MRKCIRCQAEMLENYDIKVEGEGYGIVVANSAKFFAKRLGKPKVAVCPECGEVSIYVEETEKLK